MLLTSLWQGNKNNKKKKNMRKLSAELMHPQALDYNSQEPTKTRKQKQMRLKLQEHHQLNHLNHHQSIRTTSTQLDSFLLTTKKKERNRGKLQEQSNFI